MSLILCGIGMWCFGPAGQLGGHRVAFVQAPVSAGRPVSPDMGNTILAGRYRLGMRLVVADLGDIAGTMRVVAEEFACATDPVFSPDGTRLAFAGKRAANDHLQIWEFAGDDPNPRNVFACDADCITPVYIPNGHIVFASLLSREYEEHGGEHSFSLYEWAPGGESPVRLTFNPSSEFDPAVLPDGRLIFSSWQHVGNHHWPRGTIALMLVNSDGTGVFPLTGNHRGPWLKRGAVPLPKWVADGPSPTGGGRYPAGGASSGSDLVSFIRAERFADFGAGELVTTSLNDAFAPYRTLLDSGRYEVSDARPLANGGLLLSARPAMTAEHAQASERTFGLYRLDKGVLGKVHDDPDYHELAPASGAPRARPDMRISTVVPEKSYGYLAVLNCYDTDRKDQHDLRDGSVRSVRVIEGRPIHRTDRNGPEFFSVQGREDEPLIRPNSATGYIPARILGEVPPAEDGSIYLKVPADTPLRMQLVDREGFAIINERAWFWVRPNERRVCIGCHEDRELSPANAVPLATRRQPTDLTDPAGWRTISFVKDIQPILTKTCATTDCHVPPTPTAGLNQTADQLNGDRDAVLADRFGPAYANLLARQEDKPFAVGGRRIHPGDARSSPLLWMLYGRALAKQYARARFERPLLSAHPGPMLPEAQLELFRTWVDLGAPYDSVSAPGEWPYKLPAVSAEERQR